MMIVALAPGVHAQTQPPLTLDQVRKLVSISAPDATIAREIETRGIAFVPSPETVNRLRQQGAGPKTLRALENLIPRLDEAREKIPTLLEIIYKELDQGNRATLSALVFKELLDDPNLLDQICPPFAYQAHSIESIVELQRSQFTVRVHFLSRDFKERVYELEFVPVGENLMLRNLQGLEEPLRPEQKQQGADTARRLAFAVCAGRSDVLEQVATPGLLRGVANARDRDQSGWGVFAKCGSSPVQMTNVRTQDYSGIKVYASFSGLGINHLEVLVDLVENSWRVVAVKSGQRVAQDPDLRAYTQARFGISPPPEAAGAAEPAGGLPAGTWAGDITQPGSEGYSAILTLESSRNGQIGFEPHACGGTLNFLRQEGQRHVFEFARTYGDRCADQVTVVLEPNPDGSLRIEEIYGGRTVSSGTLYVSAAPVAVAGATGPGSTPVQTFAVGHRHKTMVENFNMATTFCYGNLIVGPGTAVRYVCNQPDTQFNRCENGRFENIREVKFNRDGTLRISLKRGGNWDFSADPAELERANRAIQALPTLP